MYLMGENFKLPVALFDHVQSMNTVNIFPKISTELRSFKGKLEFKGNN